jgi:hypothetical protein
MPTNSWKGKIHWMAPLYAKQLLICALWGIDPKRISEMNDDKELEQLADLLKQSLIEEYKTAYSERGAEYEDETKATLTKF